MKNKILRLIAIIVISISYVPDLKAQTNASTEEIASALIAMESKIVKLCGMITDFTPIKGSLLTNMDDGTMVYNVKDCDVMLANNQYIIIKPNGATFYIATYGDNDRVLQMSSGTFNLVRSPFKVERDNIKSTEEEEIQSLFFDGVKVGTYMLNKKKGEGRMTIGFL